ncbi:unnamed protein product, partial [Laminaria digitata]
NAFIKETCQEFDDDEFSLGKSVSGGSSTRLEASANGGSDSPSGHSRDDQDSSTISPAASASTTAPKQTAQGSPAASTGDLPASPPGTPTREPSSQRTTPPNYLRW